MYYSATTVDEELTVTDDRPILTSRAGAVATLQLNRPQRLNALTAELLAGLRAALEDCAADDAVRAVLLTGSGKGFCAGQDLGERDPRTLDGPLDLEAIQKAQFHPIVTLMAEMPKPVVVAVNGIAAGAGASLALAGDIVLAGPVARFILSFVKVGLSVDAGGGWQLVQALGPARARALLMTGGQLTAEEAAAAGLIWRCVPDETLGLEAAGLAEDLAGAPRHAIAGIKRSVAAAQSLPFQDYLAVEAACQGRAGAAPDYAEGVLSFLEKRPARFS